VSSRADHETYSEWDAAYVLGALSSADRREFQEHLRGCDACAASVAGLVGIPGLLGRVSDADGLALLDAPSAAEKELPITLLPRLEFAARRDRRRRLTATWSIAAAAAAAGVVGTLMLAPLLDRPTAETVTVELQPVADIRLTASVELTASDGGTQIEMICHYPYQAPDIEKLVLERSYDLFVIDAAGKSERMSTWTSRPGSSVRLNVTAGTSPDDIESIEVRATDSGDVLLETVLD
jgi:hypothetical protein